MNYDDTSKFARLQNPEWKQDSKKPLGGKGTRKKKGDDRPVVRFISYRCRLLDKDNLYSGCKNLLDCVRQDGCLVPGDSETQIEFIAEQIKVPHRSEERTEIVIDY